MNLEAAEETRRLAEGQAAPGKNVKVSTFRCDVSNEAQVLDFARHVAASHAVGNRGLLLFNNAGLASGNSFVNDSREVWERGFNRSLR